MQQTAVDAVTLLDVRRGRQLFDRLHVHRWPAGCILIVVSVVILLFAFGVTITVFRKIFAKVRCMFT